MSTNDYKPMGVLQMSRERIRLCDFHAEVKNFEE